MKKALLIASVLFIAVISTACINNIAVQELNNKAAEYMQKGDYDSAINRLQASIDLDATMFETYYNLGIAATSAKKYDIAIEAFKNGLTIKPDFNNFYYSLAIVQVEKADAILEDESAKEEVKNEAQSLRREALGYLEKYLKNNPSADDKDDVETLMTELSEDLSEKSL